MNKLQFTGISDVGKKRSGNEDRYYVDWCWDEQHLLALCIDGCGGYAGGQIAAQMTVDNVCEFQATGIFDFPHHFQRILRCPGQGAVAVGNESHAVIVLFFHKSQLIRPD